MCEYCIKYGTKPETNSKALDKVIEKVDKKNKDNPTSYVKSLILGVCG